MKKLFQKIVYYFIIQCLLILLSINLVKSSNGENNVSLSQLFKENDIKTKIKGNGYLGEERELKAINLVKSKEDSNTEGNIIVESQNEGQKYVSFGKFLNEEEKIKVINNIKREENKENTEGKIKSQHFESKKEEKHVIWSDHLINNEDKKEKERKQKIDETFVKATKKAKLEKLFREINLKENEIFFEELKEIKKLNPKIINFLKNNKAFEMLKNMVKQNELNGNLEKLGSSLKNLEENKFNILLELKDLCVDINEKCKECKEVNVYLKKIGIKFVKKAETEMTKLEEENIKKEIEEIFRRIEK